MRYLIMILIALIATVVLADASVDLGNGKTRFDLAKTWCAQFDNDPRLTYYIIDGTRVVFSRSCGL